MQQEEEAKGGQGAGAKFRIDPWEREDNAGRRSFGATCVLEGYVRVLNNRWVVGWGGGRNNCTLTFERTDNAQGELHREGRRERIGGAGRPLRGAGRRHERAVRACMTLNLVDIKSHQPG